MSGINIGDIMDLSQDPKAARQAQIDKAIRLSAMFANHTPDELRAEVEYQRGHITNLVERNNLELDRRRAAERDAEQLRAELTLLRNECGRLRTLLAHVGRIAEEQRTDMMTARDLRPLVAQRFPTPTD